MSTLAAPTELLAQEDLNYLQQKGYQYAVTQTDGLIYVVIRQYKLPPAYTPSQTDMLLRLPPNFPMARPDMFWTFPHVRRAANGSYPQACETFDVNYEGQQWQRWSRHFDAKLWRPGVDNLKTYLGTIKHELEKGI
jgi:hypothetical protein